MVFPSLKPREFLRLLKRQPLKYVIVAQEGSHRKLESKNGYPPIGLSYHDKDTIPPGVVRKYLLDHIGLSEEEAKRLL